MKRKEALSTLVPGGLLLGMGIGMFFGKAGAGLFIGLGVGLIFYGFLSAFLRNS